MDLIERIFDAACDPGGLAPAVDDIRLAFDSDAAFYMLNDAVTGKGSMAVTAGVDPDARLRYPEFAAQNPRARAAASHMRLGEVASGADYVDDRIFKRSAFYQEFVKPLGILPEVGTLVERTGTSVGILLLSRSTCGPAYSRRERQALAVVSRYLNRALQVQHRLQSVEHALQNERLALERCGVAMLLLGAGGQLVFANTCAEALLREGRVVRQRDGAHASHMATFLPVRLAPVANHGPSPEVAVYLQRTDVDRAANMDPAVLRRLFGLTQSEARLAALLAQGHDVAHAAREMGQRVNTTRCMLKSVFAKTGTHRQAELLSLVLSCSSA
jgi:DNA-binding CsgD family transcriptional regulator